MVYRPSAWVMLMISMSRFIALIYEHMLNLSVKSKARSLSVFVLSIIVFLTDSYAINCGDDLAIVGQFDQQRLRLVAQTVHEIEGEDRHHLTDLGMAYDLDDGALLII